MRNLTLPQFPSLWARVKIGEGEIADIVYGKALRKQERAGTGGIPVYGSSGVVGEHDEFLHPGPSIVIGRKGTVGSIYFVREPFWCIDTAFYLDNIHPAVDIEFLAHVLKILNLSRLSIVVGVPGISRKDIEAQQIPVPPLPEQRRIVDILRRADELRQLRRQANQRAQALLPALFNEMFLSSESELRDWGTVKLRRIAPFVTSGPRGWATYYSDSGGLFIRVQDVGEGELLLEEPAYVRPEDGPDKERACIEPGDLLITITGTVGRVAIAPPDIGEAYVSQHVAIVRLDGSASSTFVASYLNHPLGGQAQIARLNYGQTKPGLNLTQIQDLEIPTPPEPLVSRFEESAQLIREIRNYWVESERGGQKLFHSMFTRAFTGELTAAWREAHAKELHEAVAERDRLLGLRIEEPYKVDATTGQVTAVNQQALARMVADRMEPAVRQFLEGLTSDQFVNLVAQLAWGPLAESLRPVAADYSEAVSRALSQCVADLNYDLIAGLARAVQPLAESVPMSLAEAARHSVDVLSLALAREAAEMAAQIHAATKAPAPQTDRAVHSVLDPLTLSLLRAAEARSAYFRPEDVTQKEVWPVEAEERLQLLAALGFVRLVDVRGQLRYRLVDSVAERALPEEL